MANIHDIVVDCARPASLARFWAEVLDDYAVAPYDEAELARLRSKGINDPEDDPTVLVESLPGIRPRLFFQRVPEGKTAKNRVHLDVDAAPGVPFGDERRHAVRRRADEVIALGATKLGEGDELGSFWIVLQDPEGNEFCLH